LHVVALVSPGEAKCLGLICPHIQKPAERIESIGKPVPSPPEGERARVRGLIEGILFVPSAHLSPNPDHNAVEAFTNLGIPNPDDTNPLFLQVSIPFHVLSPTVGICVPAPIYFNRYFLLRAIEVQNVWSQRMLASELEPRLLSIPQSFP
jgi:hypothetical protein